MAILFRFLTQRLANTSAGTRRVVLYDFIDALRGYAVLLVITGHTGMALIELPYPVRQGCSTLWYSGHSDQTIDAREGGAIAVLG